VFVVWAVDGSTFTLLTTARQANAVKIPSIFTWQQPQKQGLPMRTVHTFTRYAITFVQRAAAAEGLDVCIESLP